jgi:hypothetical protein
MIQFFAKKCREKFEPIGSGQSRRSHSAFVLE